METLEEESLTCPDKFDFPFPAYDIQNDFMKTLYKTIDERNFGIFESPTGTGKSLSIICGSIRWLKDHNELQKKSLTKIVEKYQVEKEKLSEETSDWLTLKSKEIEMKQKLDKIRMKLNKIIEYEQRIEKIMQSVKSKNINYEEIRQKGIKSLRKFATVEQKKSENIDDDLLVCDELEDETDQEEDVDEDNDYKYEPVKIYICSRTHSQLAQLVGEIVKSPFGNNVRSISLASRQVYCINPDVKRLKSINERCLDMQKNNKTKKDENGKVLKKQRTESKQCPYYKAQNIEDLKDVALSEILDVEDLVVAGRELKACPYYASRKAADDSEIVLIPYNTLLHKATREANGINLKNNVIIIDEAHNLLESLAQMYNSELSLLQIDFALKQLMGYKTRFGTRLSSTNLLMINQLVFVIKKLKNILDSNKESLKEVKTDIFTLGNFVLIAEIDNFNMFKLIKFVKKTKLSQKIHHYALKYPDDEKAPQKSAKGLKTFLTNLSNTKTKTKPTNDTPEPEASEKKPQEQAPVNPLVSVVSFLESLTYSYEDGRVLVVQNPETKLSKFQFLLLNPSSRFTDIVKDARSVIVAGGTMKPIGEFKNRLFISSGVEPNKIVEFSCDHIISPDNILPIIVTKGLEDQSLYFNFENRMKLGPNIKHILLETCRTVVGGIVVFFPSYHYENWVWEQLKDVSFGRPVFREPKGAGSVEAVLEKYAATIKKSKKTGALLFSVVGGKLSEGLNFSDDLGRCVIVIGLPYANIKAADLKEKMKYLNDLEGSGAGTEFYDNLCMKAVNQCIGRAVRHKNDYAVVLLVDERYNRSSTKAALPGWIKRSLRVNNCNGTFELIEKFFQSRN